jgi:putative membrane protein
MRPEPVLPLHTHHPPAPSGPEIADWLAALAAAGGVGLYLLAAVWLRRRGDGWPWWRAVSFTAGGVGLAIAALARLPAGEFTVHMGRHLLVGMVAPLLLILARPLTLALRVMTGRPRRSLLSLSRSRAVAWLVFPPLAAIVDVAGLWLLYRTGLFSATHDNPWLHAMVHLHVLAAGLLFTFAICQVDPVRRRHGLVLRAGSLVVAGAAHAVLAKTLYGAPPPGAALAATDLTRGAELMYYGGDLVEIALAVVLAVQWYAASGRELTRARRRRSPSANRSAA